MFNKFPTYDPSASPMTEDTKPAEQGALWSHVYKAHDLTAQDRYPYRVRAAFRFAREVATALGIIQPGDMVGRVLKDDGFNTPLEDLVDLSAGKKSRAFHRQIREIYSVFNKDLGLGPPPLPDPLPKRYNPNQHPSQDEPYSAFTTVMEYVFGYLRISEGSPEDPDQGWLGTCTFLDPITLRETWPRWDDVRDFEEFMVQQTIEEYAAHGEATARRLLHHRYGFTALEIRATIQAARNEIIYRAEFDIDFHKAMAIQRLESLIQRSREACNINMELRAVKELNLVVGLGKIAPEDTFQVFAEAVTELALEGRTQKRLQSSMQGLPPLLEAELIHTPRPEPTNHE